MPEIQGDRLDVSAEEQRYLRRAFRRFALPYVLLGFALGAVTAALPLWIEAQPQASGDAGEPRSREELAALRSELATLSERTLGTEQTLVKLRERLSVLEGRGGEQADASRLEEQLAGLGSRMARIEGQLADLRAPAPIQAPAPAAQALQ
jgi:hypothetical protein